MVKYYREEHGPVTSEKAKQNEAIFLSSDKDLINLNWEQWIRDSAVLFTENDERENFKIPDHFLPIIRRLYDAFLQPTILRGFVDLINHIAPTVTVFSSLKYELCCRDIFAVELGKLI